jgi:ZIP family zinc transporter
MSNNDNQGIAFGAVFAAGGSTAIGAAIVFFPKLVKLASRKVLASSLGISAGVMTYVSFVEIFQKSVGAFDDMNFKKILDEDKRAGRANLYAALSFFLGVVIMMVIDVVIKWISSASSNSHDHHDISDTLNKVEKGSEAGKSEEGGDGLTPGCACCSTDPVGDLESWQLKAAEELKASEELQKQIQKEKSPSADEDIEASQENVEKEIEDKKLIKMGMQTALAIALHNFPEGLATYVAVLDDPKVGALLAIAIAIHNIPEGFCVSLPIYYATGDRKKAFMWGALSGVTEPIGALLGYLVLANTVSQASYGVMFGLVAGMMVMISLKELLPTAYRYDPADTVVTNSLVVGMFVIAASLVLFVL